MMAFRATDIFMFPKPPVTGGGGGRWHLRVPAASSRTSPHPTTARPPHLGRTRRPSFPCTRKGVPP